MTPQQQAKTFFFECNAVGYFSGEELPTIPGRYHYTPYRGAGHYKLGVALDAHGPQRCYYLVAGQRYHFTVRSLRSGGFLDLVDFSPSI